MPDPRQGVFETLLVADGRPIELDAHLARLEASLAELFPERARPDLDRVEARVQSGAMRIDVAPRTDRLEARISFREPEARFGSAALHSLAVAGGLGTHKWADRAALDEVQDGLPVDALSLLVDTDGAVLEASRANLFAVRDGALFTPPLDGRILPGITRMRTIEIAAAGGIETEEGELVVADLFAADEVFLTGSVRGIEPAASLDGAALPGGGPIASALAAELRRAWLGAPVV